jgi:transposase
MLRAPGKFHGLHAVFPWPVTTEALRRTAELYMVESDFRDKPTD